ncbi:FUZ/MON1/HPS1 first Longin domain-containing protein [Entamoeba marina]
MSSNLSHPQQININNLYHPSTQILIFTPAGKPVFTLHGDPILLSSTIATMTAILSYTHDNSIQSLQTKTHSIHFITTPPLYYCIITTSTECSRVIFSQMDFIAHVLHSFITRPTITNTLKEASNYDLRPVVFPRYALLKTAVETASNALGICIGCVAVRALPNLLRNKIELIIENTTTITNNVLVSDVILFSLIFVENQLVAIRARNKSTLSARDLLVFICYINVNYSVGKKAFLPICLSDFNDSAFVHAYFKFLSDKITIIGVATLPDSIMELDQFCTTIENGIKDIPLEVSGVKCPAILDGRALFCAVTKDHQIFTDGIIPKEIQNEVANALSRNYTEELITKDYTLIHKRLDDVEIVVVLNCLLEKKEMMSIIEEIFIWIDEMEEMLWLNHPPLW